MLWAGFVKPTIIIMDNIQETTTPTLGEQRVRTTFNPSNESVVDRIKQKSAELIDLLQAVSLWAKKAWFFSYH